MIRSAAVLYLILATLAGPRLCPCSVAWVGQPPSSPSMPLNGVPPVCGCCAPLSGLTPGVTSQPPGEQRPDQPSAPCPCQCGKQDTAATVRVPGRAVKSSVDYGGFPEAVPGWDAHHLALVPQLFGIDHVRDLPFWTTDDLLRVFHRLRC